MKNFIGFTILLLISLTFGCNKFITQEPKYLLSSDVAIIDEASAEALLNGAYAAVGTNDYTARFTGGFSSMLGVYNYNFSAYNFNMTAFGDNETLWKSFYLTINRANAVIKNVPKLSDNEFRVVERKNEIIAEARGLRAFAHLYAFWYFGQWNGVENSEFGIIYRDEIADLSNIYMPRLTVKDSYDKIIEDLDFAIAYCPNYKTGKRFSSQLAKALKAKLLINRGWAQDYTEALKLVNEVIAEASGVGNMLESSLTQLYKNSWDSKELLFCRYREKTDDIISAYNFTYGYNYAITAINLGAAILETDSRYNEGWGLVRYPSATPATMNWRPKKLCREGRYIGGDNDKYTTYFLRLTEVYLMQAELRYRVGQTFDEALKPLNIIRGRSGLAAAGATNNVDMERLLFDEYFKELNLENDADWMASLRLKGTDGRRMLYEFRGGNLAVDENRFIWPIPSSEIKYNKLIKQNPSYEELTY